MRRSLILAAPLVAALMGTGACSRPPGPSHQVAAPAPPPPVAPPAPPAPAKKATMICRNSVDGRNVKCGTPNAVMVGIKTE